MNGIRSWGGVVYMNPKLYGSWIRRPSMNKLSKTNDFHIIISWSVELHFVSCLINISNDCLKICIEVLFYFIFIKVYMIFFLSIVWGSSFFVCLFLSHIWRFSRVPPASEPRNRSWQSGRGAYGMLETEPWPIPVQPCGPEFNFEIICVHTQH